MISKGKRGIIILIVIVLVISGLMLLEKMKKITYASNENIIIASANEYVGNTLKISSAESVDIDEYISKNSVSSGFKEEIIVKNEELEYITKYRNNPNIYIGKTKVAQEGRGGIQAITIKKVYNEKGEVIKEEQLSAVVVKASINKVIDIGTKKKEVPTPIPKYGNGVQIGSTSGKLDFNMALNKPSGFSLEQFTKALTDKKDKNKVFQDNAKYFYYAERQYNVNGIFVAAVGIHESAWATSRISRDKHNLFGYGAYDSNPYNGAYKFETFAESIDLVSRVFMKYYLNPKGTIIYGKEKANGKYYNGNTLSSVNKKYATDKNWAKGVYTHMQYLYNKIGK